MTSCAVYLNDRLVSVTSRIEKHFLIFSARPAILYLYYMYHLPKAVYIFDLLFYGFIRFLIFY